MFKKNNKLFTLTERTFGKKYHAVYQNVFLSKRDLAQAEITDLYETIDKKW